MKTVCLIPLLFLTACSSPPKLALYPQPPPPAMNNAAVRFPELVRAYHVGRYADPNDDLVMHEQHVVYRVEENTRWDCRPGPIVNDFALPRDAAFNSAPVNDAVLAEVNSQRLATAQIVVQARQLSALLAQVQTSLQETKTNLQASAALRPALAEVMKRLAALETARQQQPSPSTVTTNEPAELMSP